MKQFLLIILCITTSLSVLGQTETECTQTLSGEVRDGISTDVLVGAEVLLTDSSGAIVETQVIKEDGAFSFTIKCETAYKIEGIQEDYTSESKTFSTTNEDKRELKLIILLDKGNIDFVSDSQANAKAIDSVAKAEVVTAEVKPDIVAEEIKEPVVRSEKKIDKKPKRTVDVLPKPVLPQSRDEYFMKIDPVYFDYESSWLDEKKRSELQKVVKLLKQYPKMVLECAGHTDSKGDNEYNMWMSKRRGKRVADFIISKGISPSRVSNNGYGETQLVNECTNDVECTDEQRAANRRTEFVIVKM